jgi:hypothetical protein
MAKLRVERGLTSNAYIANLAAEEAKHLPKTHVQCQDFTEYVILQDLPMHFDLWRQVEKLVGTGVYRDIADMVSSGLKHVVEEHAKLASFNN